MYIFVDYNIKAKDKVLEEFYRVDGVLFPAWGNPLCK